MTAVMTTLANAKPSPETLARIETVLTLTLIAQMIGLVVRYTL